MWAIIDDNGTVHSGSEQEMREAWEAMNRDEYSVSENDELVLGKWLTSWTGDLKLIQIHAITR